MEYDVGYDEIRLDLFILVHETTGVILEVEAVTSVDAQRRAEHICANSRFLFPPGNWDIVNHYTPEEQDLL